ncbi:Heteroproteinous nuclear ribonucleoprotein H [Chamberlinius hualienensis]
MRGLPFRASVQDIIDFFRPLNPVNVNIIYEDSGRASGEADVEFASHDEAMKAMSKDKSNIQHRYIELFLNSTPQGNQNFGLGPIGSGGGGGLNFGGGMGNGMGNDNFGGGYGGGSQGNMGNNFFNSGGMGNSLGGGGGMGGFGNQGGGMGGMGMGGQNLMGGGGGGGNYTPF